MANEGKKLNASDSGREFETGMIYRTGEFMESRKRKGSERRGEGEESTDRGIEVNKGTRLQDGGKKNEVSQCSAPV